MQFYALPRAVPTTLLLLWLLLLASPLSPLVPLLLLIRGFFVGGSVVATGTLPLMWVYSTLCFRFLNDMTNEDTVRIE